ncbi:MAG: hypothetical protein LC104_06585 [Bacteroidales bacterium]|nr:hypothetical protein [Bacteroidales bacterium]
MHERRIHIAISIVLLIIVAFCSYRVYRWSPGAVQDCDSSYSLAAGEMFVKHGTMQLNRAMPDNHSLMPGYAESNQLPYQLIRHSYDAPSGQDVPIYYGYPLGSVIFSLPLIHYYTTTRHLSCFGGDGHYFADGERRLQLKLAAIVATLAVGVFFLIAWTLLPSWAAVLVALGYAFGSMSWSTLSRGMWSHTWLSVELGLAVWMLTLLVRFPERSRWINLIIGGIIGIAFIAIYYTRPQAVVSVAAIGAYLVLFERRVLFITFLVAALITGVAVAFSLHAFGQPFPPSVYNPSDIDGRDVLSRFWHLMMSPSRGLILYCPYLLVTGYWIIAYRHHLGKWARLLIPAGMAIGAHVAILSAYIGWYGGSCYGPRYFCDVLPWFVLASSIAVRGLLHRPCVRIPVRLIVETAILVLFVAWSVFVHGRGAVSRTAWEWNYRGVQEDMGTAVTDWQHPQFLAGITFVVMPDGSYQDLP